jgi:zinc transport system substrate-binding protein
MSLFQGLSYARDEKPLVLVSVAAYQEIVQEMAGEDIDVRSVVPPGMSFHTFEPTPSLIQSLYTADLWLIIGDPFEKKILSALQSTQHPPNLIDLRQGLETLHDTACHGCSEGADPHIWTSPRMMKLQLTTIRNGLTSIFPTKKEGIEERYLELQRRIDNLIGEADERLAGQQGKLIVIAHGAFGYLCRDFGLEQRAIETGGKEATARSLYDLLQEAKQKGVTTIFSLKQYPKKGIDRVAEALHAKVIELDAYQSDYFSGMHYTIKAFHTALEQERE